VLFIRHGESEANRANVIVSYQGDPALTDKGIKEAQLVAQRWADVPLAGVFSSPLKRTQQTAAYFLRPGMSVVVDDRLHEIGLGRWDGLTIEEIEARDALRYRQWKEDPELGAAGGGEPLSAVADRVQSFLSDLRHQYDEGTFVAATHSDCLKALLLSVLHAPWQSAQWLHLTNTAGLVVQWRQHGWQLMVHPVAP
jgi:broad specificity phosphatase PhoE